MIVAALRRLRHTVERALPERHVYVRDGEDWWVAGFSTRAQLVGGAGAAALLAWIVGATAVTLYPSDHGASRQRLHYERLIAERQARLDLAVRKLSDRNDPLGRLTVDLERRHEALAMLVDQIQPGALAAAETAQGTAPAGIGPLARLQALKQGQDSLLARTEAFAKTRADRLRLALRIAGVDPGAVARSNAGGAFGPRAPGQGVPVQGALGQAALGMGGPLIAADDPRALAAMLNVDTPFAGRIQHAARDLGTAGALSSAAAQLPLSQPVSDPVRSSGFGVRSDPFTGVAAFHAGQDFSGRMGTPVAATGAGIVSFTGQRTGYGNTVEIDHGQGFKTRYAHLSAFAVGVGQRVTAGQRIGAMGSTGRSTGVHLHYEVWVNGRVQDPNRYLKAGDYVHANG